MFKNIKNNLYIYQNNDLNKVFSNLFIFLIIAIVFIRGFNSLADWDAINYIANGISLWHEGKPIVVYPGILFSLFTVFLAEHLFGNTQFSSFVFLAIIPLSTTIIFSYKICRLYIKRSYSICTLATIFMFFDYDCGISYMLLQAYSDGWLLMFLTMAGFASLKDKYILAAITIGLAYFFRSQAFIFAIFIPILFQNRSLFRLIKYFSILIVTILIISFVFYFIFPTQNKGEFNFYANWFNAFSIYSNLKLEDIFNHLIFFVYHFKKSLVLIICSILLVIIARKKTKYFEFKKIFYFGVFLFVFQLCATIHLIFIGVSISAGENRYFIYSALFSSLGAFIALSKWCEINKNIKKIFLLFILVLFIGRFLFALYSLMNIEKRFYEHDFDMSNIPMIPKNSNIGVVGHIGQGILYNIFKNQKWIGEYSFSCKELMDNKSIDYIFVTNPSLCTENKDNNNSKYKKIWESKKPYREFILLKKLDNKLIE